MAGLLEKNCVSCHKSSSASGGLDLSRWQDLGELGRGFLHIVQGEQVSPEETLMRIKDRLSSTDPTKRMPLNMFISPSELDAIFLWTEQSLRVVQ